MEVRVGGAKNAWSPFVARVNLLRFCLLPTCNFATSSRCNALVRMTVGEKDLEAS